MGGDLDRLLRQDSPPPRRNSVRPCQPPSAGLLSLLHSDASLSAGVPASSPRRLPPNAPSQGQSAPLGSEHRPGSRTESLPEASLGDAPDNAAVPSAPSWTAVNRLPPIRNIAADEERRLSPLHDHARGSEQFGNTLPARQELTVAPAQYRRHSPPRVEAERLPVSTVASVDVGHSRAATTASPISISRQAFSASGQVKGTGTFKRASKPEESMSRPQQDAFAGTAPSQLSGFPARDDSITTPPSPAPSPEIGSAIANPVSAATPGLERHSIIKDFCLHLKRDHPSSPPALVSRPAIGRSASVNSAVKPRSKTLSHSRRRARSVRFAEQSTMGEMATSPNIAYLTAHAAGTLQEPVVPDHTSIVVSHQGNPSSRPPLPHSFDQTTSAATPASTTEVVYGQDSRNPPQLLPETQLNAASEQQGQELPAGRAVCTHCGESWAFPPRYIPPPTDMSQFFLRLRENRTIHAELAETWHANHHCRPQSASTRGTASSSSPPPPQDSSSQSGKRKEHADPDDAQMSSKMHRVSFDSPFPHVCQPSPPPEPCSDANSEYVDLHVQSSGFWPSDIHRVRKSVAQLIGAEVGARVPQQQVKADWTSMWHLPDDVEGRNKATRRSSKDVVMIDEGNDGV